MDNGCPENLLSFLLLPLRALQICHSTAAPPEASPPSSLAPPNSPWIIPSERAVYGEGDWRPLHRESPLQTGRYPHAYLEGSKSCYVLSQVQLCQQGIKSGRKEDSSLHFPFNIQIKCSLLQKPFLTFLFHLEKVPWMRHSFTSNPNTYAVHSPPPPVHSLVPGEGQTMTITLLLWNFWRLTEHTFKLPFFTHQTETAGCPWGG